MWNVWFCFPVKKVLNNEKLFFVNSSLTQNYIFENPLHCAMILFR